MTTTARVVVLPQTGTELRVETVDCRSSATTSGGQTIASGICHSQLHQIHRSAKPSGTRS